MTIFNFKMLKPIAFLNLSKIVWKQERSYLKKFFYFDMYIKTFSLMNNDGLKKNLKIQTNLSENCRENIINQVRNILD
jgi:hypothetical protein